MKIKQYKKIVIVLILICAAILFEGVERGLGRQLSTQQAAAEWSEKKNYAQITCFFSEEAGMTRNMIVPIEYQLRNALQEASEDTSDENGRNLVDCYSSETSLTLYSDRSSITARAFAVGGDFFTFHPLKLLSGNYFDGEDLNDDGVILDENVAWQLFGSNNVAGMYVEINGVQYPVRGVVESDSGYFSKAVDEEAATVYVSYGIVESSGSSSSYTDGNDISGMGSGSTTATIDSYEILIKNPVQRFGYNALKEATGLDESQYVMVENSTRFGVKNRLEILRNFGVRSMSTKKITYPYWENRARGYEDIAALLLVLEGLCLIYPVLYACGRLHFFWKHKKEYGERAKVFFIQLIRQFPIWLKNAKKPGKIFTRKKKTT